MGPVGASIGLGLKAGGLEKTEIIGVAPDRSSLGKALKLQALDKTSSDLAKSVKGAGLVVLDTPAVSLENVLECIGPSVESGCVVTDTRPGKIRASRLAKTHLRNDAHFVAGRPIFKKPFPNVVDLSADIFQGIDYCVICGDDVDEDAIATVVGMVHTLGATPFFLDAFEQDSFDAAVVHLPLILSAALLKSISESPSWKETARLSGPEFDILTKISVTDPRENAVASLGSPEALTMWIDRLILELNQYRDGISQGGDSLAQMLVDAWEVRKMLEVGADEDTNTFDIPNSTQTMAASIFGRHLTERYHQIATASKHPKWRFPGTREQTKQ